LKSRGLAKSLEFSHQFHNLVLFKTKIALEKPEGMTINRSNSHPYDMAFDEEDELDESLDNKILTRTNK